MNAVPGILVLWAIGLYLVAHRSPKGRRTFYVMLMAWIVYALGGLAIGVAFLSGRRTGQGSPRDGRSDWFDLTAVFSSCWVLARQKIEGAAGSNVQQMTC